MAKNSQLIKDIVCCTHCSKCTEIEIPVNATVEAGKILVSVQGGDDDGKTIQVGSYQCPRCHSDHVNSIDL